VKILTPSSAGIAAAGIANPINADTINIKNTRLDTTFLLSLSPGGRKGVFYALPVANIILPELSSEPKTSRAVLGVPAVSSK
jgi:hypothetical protein